MEHTLTTKHVEVFRDLLQRLHNNDKMSFAEKECICCLLLVRKNYNSISSVNVAAVPGCQDCIFRILYVSYCLDLEGKYGIDKYDGLVSIDEKRGDVIRLNEVFHAWERVVSKNNYKGNNL